MSEKEFKVWVIRKGALNHVDEPFLIAQVPTMKKVMVLLGDALHLINEATEKLKLPQPTVVYGTRGIAALDPEWDGRSEYVCEGCGELESADDRVAGNLYKRAKES